jgi:hypothetical protein
VLVMCCQYHQGMPGMLIAPTTSRLSVSSSCACRHCHMVMSVTTLGRMCLLLTDHKALTHMSQCQLRQSGQTYPGCIGPGHVVSATVQNNCTGSSGASNVVAVYEA